MDVADIRDVFLFDGLTDEQLIELLEAGEEVAFEPGDVLFRQAEPAEFWWVLVEGKIALRRRAGNEERVLGVMERPGVWAGGFLAWAESSSYRDHRRGGSGHPKTPKPLTFLHVNTDRNNFK